MTDTDRVPHRPGPIGRIARLVLGLVVLQAAYIAAAALVDGVSGAPDADDTGLISVALLTAWVTPTVFDLGLGASLGSMWRALAAVGVAVSALVGAALGAPGTGVTVGILVWIAVTLGWLGLAFLVAVVLRTPGCEMRSLAHLASMVASGDRDFAECPGPLQPLGEWEARATGRAEPYVPH